MKTHSSPISLGHTSGIGIKQKPMAEGVAVTSDGALAVVANRYNASVTVVDLRSATVVKEIDLRPGAIDPSESGTAGGEYPAAVCIEGSETAFVSSERDREIVVVDLRIEPLLASSEDLEPLPPRPGQRQPQSDAPERRRQAPDSSPSTMPTWLRSSTPSGAS